MWSHKMYDITLTWHKPLSFYVVYYDTVILPKSYSTNKQSSSNITKTSLKARVIFQEVSEWYSSLLQLS